MAHRVIQSNRKINDEFKIYAEKWKLYSFHQTKYVSVCNEKTPLNITTLALLSNPVRWHNVDGEQWWVSICVSAVSEWHDEIDE